MIKLTAAISKRDDWTVEEWLTHYKERHASLSASVKAYTQYSERYLQNYAYHAPDVPDFPELGDGRVAVTEHWFPGGVEAIRAAYVEPDYFKYLRPDELRFCTFDNIVAGIAREVEVLPVADGGYGDKRHVYLPRNKIFVFRTRRPDMDVATFEKGWLDVRAPALLASGFFKTLVKRYVQSPILRDDVGLPGEVPHDLIDEFWFDTIDDAVAFWSEYRASIDAAQQDAEFIDREKTWIIFAQEHEVFGPLPD